MSRFALPLSSPEATLPIAGAKGAILSEMLQAGLPVPPGFVITTAAYQAFVATNGLESRIVELCHSAGADNPAALEVASQAIREFTAYGLIPKDVAQDITAEYRRLTETVRIPMSKAQDKSARAPIASGPAGPNPGLVPVAVRSSATTEDLPDASFAGQHETCLNVRGEAALLEAVKRCWSSLWTTRAIAYRARQDIDPLMIPIQGEGAVNQAVVVQQMVPASAAGILFTVNPLTGNPDEAVINAAWGLGEAIVNGRVVPDTIVVDKATGRVKTAIIEEKAVMTVLADQGTTQVLVEPKQRRQPALTLGQVAEVVRLGRALETQFGRPQDVEWAIAGERVHVLQSRPVTGLPEIRPVPLADQPTVPGDDDWPAVDERPPQTFDLWTQINVGEAFPQPVSPLVWSGIPFIVSGGIRYALRGLNSPHVNAIQWANRFYGRVFYNEGALAHVLSKELGLPGSLVDAAMGSRRSVNQRHSDRFRPIQFLRRLPFLLRTTMRQLRTGRELEDLFSQINHWVAGFTGQDLDKLTDRQLWVAFGVWVERFMQAMNLHTEMSVSAITAFALLERLTEHWFGRKNLAHDLVAGLSGIYAAEIGDALWQMAQTLCKVGLAKVVLENDPQTALARLQQVHAAQPMIQMLNSFLQRYGHHCPNEAEWLHPCWRDEPEQVIAIVAAYLRAGDRINLREAEARQRRRREEAIVWARANLDPFCRRIFQFVLTRTQHLVRLRDNGKHYYMKASFPIRRVHALFGRRWTSHGWLGQPDDIFFLTILDIEKIVDAGDPGAAGIDLRALVAQRRKAFEYWFDVEPPDVIGADGQPIAFKAAREPMPGRVLRGIPASSGQVRGTARIIHDPREAARLQQGDILVTRATDPGWTSVFPLVAGLVIEIGGQLSHASIVAREYGVPAVVNVHNATRFLNDGETVTVDGATGCIYLEGAEVVFSETLGFNF